MLQNILLAVQIIISIALTGVILLQRSEGGALGMGGGPSGFMTARGAGNLLTRTTGVLAALFFICAIALTIVGNVQRGTGSVIDADAVGSIAVDQPAAPAQGGQAPTATPAQPTAPSLDDLEASLPGSAPAQTAPAQPAPAN